MASTTSLLFGMLVNFSCSVTVVFMNKYIFNLYHFNYGTLLSIIHFFVTWLGLWLCSRLSYFEIKPLKWREMVWLSLAYALSVPFCNLSIKYNTVGFYQISKAMVTPVAVVIQFLFYKKTFSLPILLSLVPICIGVSITGFTDVEISMVGSLYSGACVLTSVLAQIWIQEKQVEFGVNSMQLLYYVVPYSIIIQSIAAPMIDDLAPSSPSSFQNYVMTTPALAVILASGLVAFFINFTVFFVIRHTSPVSYQVFGHSKTCTIIILGFFLFDSKIDKLNLLGILTTLVGVFLYTYLKLEENAEEKKVRDEKERMKDKEKGTV
eukprot:TRINITY_DN151_c0_g1_i3.p1 TRINITY_DN151_c0_g1~~TRINITY_DN151_c0_g1_i3.p1  ORF type:complete len:321 (-),score=100.45 TRINITY_DN151_c0_g1_i3:246-1208(-)